MIAFLFEQYGYYPKHLENNIFAIDGWIFHLVEGEHEEKHIEKIDEYCREIRDFFSGKGPYLIKTRFNKLVSFYDNKRYVLLCFRDCEISLKELNDFHVNFKQLNKFIDLKKMLISWNEKVSYIENNSINALRIDSVYYQNNMNVSMFCLGISQNAIQYLSECILDYGEKIDNITLVHKRLNSFKCVDVLNPFNLVIDHPVRDLIELYKNDLLGFNDFIDFIKYYVLDAKIATVCIARLLYPCSQLDLLEKNVYEKSISFKINYNIEKEYMKIKKVYEHFKVQYNIRPINWLEN